MAWIMQASYEEMINFLPPLEVLAMSTKVPTSNASGVSQPAGDASGVSLEREKPAMSTEESPSTPCDVLRFHPPAAVLLAPSPPPSSLQHHSTRPWN